MRNLIGFLWHNHFTLLFLLLEVVAFAFLVQGNRFHRASFFNSTLAVSGSVNSSIHNMTEYLHLKEVNAELAIENAALREHQVESFKQVNAYYAFVDDTLRMQQYEYLPARVVNSTVHKMNNKIIIDKGAAQGVEVGMGVTGPQGVVGQVAQVSDNYAAVLPLLHKRSQIGAQLKGSIYFGLISWQGIDPGRVTLSGIASHVLVRKGDTVVTRGSNTLFPAGVMVGTVSEVEAIPGEGEFEIEVQLATEFRALGYVYVVRNLLKEEQLLLEKQFEEEEGEGAE